MSNALRNQSPNTAFMPTSYNRDQRYRIQRYIDWLDDNNLDWQSAPLSRYKQWLEERYAKTSVRALVSSVRVRYKEMTRDNQYRDFLYSHTPSDAPMADRKAMVDEMIVRVNNAINDKAARVSVVKKRDRTDQEFVRLTYDQLQRFVELPETYWLAEVESGAVSDKVRIENRVKRDSAILALMGCTGLREAEVTGLVVDDLYQTVGNVPALLVREGKGAVQRTVPYGDLDWCLGYVEDWMGTMHIRKGAVFPAFTSRYCSAVRDGHCSTETINALFRLYSIDGLNVKPHDMRRSYASILYREFGMGIYEIQRNLGHSRVETTLGYIGEQNLEERAPRFRR